MADVSTMRTEWNEQALQTNDLAAQVARPGTEASLQELVTDISMKLLPDGPAKHILDVGCGNGLIVSKLMGNADTVVGVDYSAAMIDEARSQIPHGQFHVSEVDSLPLGDSRFTHVLCYSIFHYFPDLDYAMTAIRELLRVAAPGGIILIGDILDVRFEKQIKDNSDLNIEAKLPQIHRYSSWRFYDLTKLCSFARDHGAEAEVMEQPSSFKMQKYRRDLRLRIKA